MLMQVRLDLFVDVMVEDVIISFRFLGRFSSEIPRDVHKCGRARSYRCRCSRGRGGRSQCELPSCRVFYEIFTEDASLSLLYHGAKSQNDQRLENENQSCVKRLIFGRAFRKTSLEWILRRVSGFLCMIDLQCFTKVNSIALTHRHTKVCCT